MVSPESWVLSVKKIDGTGICFKIYGGMGDNIAELFKNIIHWEGNHLDRAGMPDSQRW